MLPGAEGSPPTIGFQHPPRGRQIGWEFLHASWPSASGSQRADRDIWEEADPMMEELPDRGSEAHHSRLQQGGFLQVTLAS